MKRLLLGFLVLAAFTNCSTPSARPSTHPSPTPESSVAPRHHAVTIESKPTPKRPERQPCRYVFPVRPSVVADYGAAHHDYPATDIFTPAGSGFVAPTDGTVDFVSRIDRWDPSVDDPATRGGLSVAIVGRDGVRYYGSHLREVASRIDKGRKVRAGEKLGEIGNSGNARGVSSHLHFGISPPTYPTDWKVRRGQISPFDYLNAWRSGKPLTPDVPGADRPRCKPSE